MKALGKKENFRVEITPRSLTDYGAVVMSRGLIYGHDAEGQKRWERDMLARCEEIAADVKRHVDSVGAVSVEFDQQYVCSHCGYAWGEESDKYNGGCCDEDEANNPTQTLMAEFDRTIAALKR